MEARRNKKQDDLTRKIIHTVDVVAFLVRCGKPKKGCILEHQDGRTAYLTMKDALNYQYTIFHPDTDEVVASFTSVEELIDHGWKAIVPEE